MAFLMKYFYPWVEMNALYNFAAGCRFKRHSYLAVEQGALVPSNHKKETLEKVVEAALNLFQAAPSHDKLLIRASLQVIRDRLYDKTHGKIASLFCWFYPREFRKIDEAIQRLDALEAFDLRAGEELFRLQFLASLPKDLGVSDAPACRRIYHRWRDGAHEAVMVHEPNVIEWISRRVFHSQNVQEQPLYQRWEVYSSLMRGLYRGDHALFEGARVEELIREGAISRVSSHYERGRVIREWRKGKPVYGGDLRRETHDADVAHYGLSGRHIRHILFHAVEMKERSEGSLVVARTARQVDHLHRAGKLKGPFSSRTRQFVALQFEWSKDCEGHDILGFCKGRGANFFTHRLIGYLLYRALKLLRVENANIGAYGLGRTDEHPVIIRPASIV
jgi:hypothetical protein